MLEGMSTAHELFTLAEVGEVYVEAASCPRVYQIVRARRRLRTTFRGEPPAVWARIEGILAAAAWRLSTIPLPHNTPAIGLQPLENEIALLVPGLFDSSELTAEVATAQEALAALCDSGENPLGDLVLAILGTAIAARSAVGLATRLALGPVEDWLKSVGMEVPILLRDRIGSAPPFETLVLVGSPRWFPAAALTAPRADSTCFVQFDWLGSPRPTEGLLPGASAGVARPMRATFSAGAHTAEPDELSPAPNWEAISARAAATARVRTSAAEPDVEARLLVLAGEYGVFVEEGDESDLMVAVAAPDGSIEIARRSARTVVPGDFVVLRSGGSAPDYIRQLADERFGAARYRAHQRRWKDALRAATAGAGGFSAAQRELKRRGARAANLRYWLRDASIRTRDPSDFRAICEFSGIASEAGTIWTAMEHIFGAHIEAGFFIRQRLEEAVERIGFGEIERSGRSDFEIEGCGSMSIYRVDGRSPATARVPEDLLKHPFQLEAGVWHE